MKLKHPRNKGAFLQKFLKNLLTLHVQSIMICVRAKKEGDVMSPLKKGTKLTDNPKNIRLEIRLTQSEADLLQECTEKLETTRTDVINRGIKLVKEEIDKKK